MSVNTVATDVLIIGGGPAGTATALALLAYSELDVSVVEYTAYDKVRVGEHISSSLFPFLDYLQVKDVLLEELHLEVYQTVAAWGQSRLQIREAFANQMGKTYQLDRNLFDLLLANQVAEKGGTVYPRTKCHQYQQLPTGEWQVNLSHASGQSFSIQAKFLVDATGRQRHVSRYLSTETQQYDALMGAGLFLTMDDASVLPQQILLETVEEGWWYVAVLPNKQLSVVLFTDADILSEQQLNKLDSWQELLVKTVHAKQLVQGSTALDKLWVRNAYSHQLCTPTDFNWVAVGDAVSAYDPISSMGIGFAMTSACHAAQAICQQFEGKVTPLHQYYQGIQTNFSNYLELRQRFYRSEKRWATLPFWQRRH